MNIIVDIQPLSYMKGLFLITLDNGKKLKASKEVIYRFNLEPDMEIDYDEISGFIYESDLGLAYNMSLKFLGYRTRSCKEIKDYLSKKGFDDPVIDTTIEKLSNYNFIDDAKFASDFKNYKMNLKPVSRRYIQYKLNEKGIDSQIIDSVVDTISDDEEVENAMKVGKRYVRKYKDLEEREARAKLGQALVRKGFDWATVNKAVNRLFSD